MEHNFSNKFKTCSLLGELVQNKFKTRSFQELEI